MTKFSYLLFSIILLVLFVNSSYGQNEQLSLEELFGKKNVLIIGESYGQIESADLVAKIVSNYVAKGRCLNVGLEIPTNQQGVLNSAIRGQISMSNVQIDNVIDHDSYREMLVNFSDQIIAGKCLSIYAINPSGSNTMSKDKWMEKEVAKIIDDKPIVLLVGNKHAVKDYVFPDGHDTQVLTQRLIERNVEVTSILQHWSQEVCPYKTVKLYNSSDQESGLYLKQVIGSDVPEQISKVADGVLVWSCNK